MHSEGLAAFLLLAIGRADLDELRFRGDLLGNMRRYFRLIAAWVGTGILLAQV
jgi:hypothetical protein